MSRARKLGMGDEAQPTTGKEEPGQKKNEQTRRGGG